MKLARRGPTLHRPCPFMENSQESLAWLARRDGTAVIASGPFKSSAEAPAEGTAFYVQDFALKDPTPWKIPHSIERTTVSGLTNRLPEIPSINVEWNPLDSAPFSEVFQEIAISIQSGVCEKTVPVVTECGRTNMNPGPAIAAAMVRQGPPLQSYGWFHPSAGFAGATPELLFSLAGTRLETMALAGTARTEDRDVFAVDDKEIREHEYVAQTLVSKLMELGELVRCPRKILDLGHIVHFLTMIQVDLDNPGKPDVLLRKLHPTPALGPLPRTGLTMDQLLQWRNRLGCPSQFGAPFGLWDEGRFDAIVAIRGVWWKGSTICIPTGCGIIRESRLVNEWRELRLKREAVKRFILPAFTTRPD